MLVFACDQMTKSLVTYYMHPVGREWEIFNHFLGIDFSIIHVSNKGAAWGMLPQLQFPLLLLRIAFITGMGIYLLLFNKSPLNVPPILLIIAGAIGNIVDTLTYGHVIDMLHFNLWGYDFPVFNIADSAICIGIFWLCLISLFHKSHEHSSLSSQ